MDDFTLKLQGYRLTTAEITYRRPDFQTLLQIFIWQQLDLAPKFPVLNKFLEFWQRELDGPLHTVRVCSSELLQPAEFHNVDGVYRLH